MHACQAVAPRRGDAHITPLVGTRGVPPHVKLIPSFSADGDDRVVVTRKSFHFFFPRREKKKE